MKRKKLVSVGREMVGWVDDPEDEDEDQQKDKPKPKRRRTLADLRLHRMFGKREAKARVVTR